MSVRPRQVPHWDLAAVGQILGDSASVVGQTDVTGISLNTSDVHPGDLYAALPGSRAHGASYAAQALADGAHAVLTDSSGTALIDPAIPHIVVNQPRQHLAALAAEFYHHPTEAFTTVGITGTQGKTTTTYLAEAALGVANAAIIGTIGTRIGGVRAASKLTTPESPALQALFAVMREEQTEACVMEVSSHALVQGRVNGFVFDVAVFLNLGRDHLDFHRDIDDYFAAKAMLFTAEHARAAVINIDDPFGQQLRDQTSLPVTTFGLTSSTADWRVSSLTLGSTESSATIHSPVGDSVDLRVPLAGEFNIANALAAIAALSSQGYELEALADGISGSTGVPGRMERIDLGQEFTAIVDYAHKPDAVAAVLNALRPLTSNRLIIVIGAGGDRDQGKRPLMGRIAADLADLVVLTDDNPRTEDPARIREELWSGAQHGVAQVQLVPGRSEAISYAVAQAAPGDTIVVAGKGHERGQEIDGVVHEFDDREELVARIEALR